jgi:predicted DNA-binding protein (MmcQ/YjbR family)
MVDTGHDFKRLNTLLPHPVYAWMSWVCVLNPDEAMIQELASLLDESYDLVVKKYAKRIKS